MTRSVERAIATASGASTVGRASSAIGLRLAALATALAIVCVVYREPLALMVHVWIHNETFTHAFLVIPTVVWLIASRRAEWMAQPLSVAPSALVVVAGGAGLMLAGRLGSVAALEQFGVVIGAMGTIITLFGWRFARLNVLPIGFLLMLVPTGEFLVPTLMEWTTTALVASLKLTGIPVLVEGMRLRIPTGSWAVVEACAGLRYLIASIALGIIYAHVAYTSRRKQLLFVAASLVVPIVANWARAYLIVMIGHLSGNELATGVDHLVYGWIFFGVVVAVLFFVGARYRDPVPEPADGSFPTEASRLRGSTSQGGILLAAATVVSMLVGAAAVDVALRARPGMPSPIAGVSSVLSDFRSAPGELGYAPVFAGSGATLSRTLLIDGAPVLVDLRFYPRQSAAGEMIAWGNTFIAHDDDVWAIVQVGTARPDVGSPAIVREYELRSGGRQLLVWGAYAVGGDIVGSDYRAKLLTALSLLRLRGDASTVLTLATPLEGSADQARQRLRTIARAVVPSLIDKGER